MGWVAKILPWFSAGHRPTTSQGWSAGGGLRSEEGKKLQIDEYLNKKKKKSHLDIEFYLSLAGSESG